MSLILVPKQCPYYKLLLVPNIFDSRVNFRILFPEDDSERVKYFKI